MSPVATACGSDSGGCPVSPHAATGWCLLETGAPVLVVTALPCPPGDPAVEITVTLIDPMTGAVVPTQAIVACGSRDWEVSQLCDFDPDTGDLIATFIQIFEWDADTQNLNITNVRADDPTIPYVPTGTVRSCSTSCNECQVVSVCFESEDDPIPGWALISIDCANEEIQNVIFYDIGFTSTVPEPTVVPCEEIDKPRSINVLFGNFGVAEPDGDTWTMFPGCQGFTVIVKSADAVNRVEFTSGFITRYITQPGYSMSASINTEHDLDLNVNAITIVAIGTATFDVLYTLK